MGTWTSSKFVTIVIFIVLMVIFFMWVSLQVGDLGIVFGFRTSHTIANDIASLMTVVNGVPGETAIKYSINPGQANQGQAFNYDIRLNKKVVCVSSFLVDETKATTDCAGHSSNLDQEYACKTVNGRIEMFIEKTESDEGNIVSVKGCSGA